MWIGAGGLTGIAAGAGGGATTTGVVGAAGVIGGATAAVVVTGGATVVVAGAAPRADVGRAVDASTSRATEAAVMHDDSLDYRMEEITVDPTSPWVWHALGQMRLQETSGALFLALRAVTGQFIANPAPSIYLEPGTILVALGTPDELDAARRHVNP